MKIVNHPPCCYAHLAANLGLIMHQADNLGPIIITTHGKPPCHPVPSPSILLFTAKLINDRLHKLQLNLSTTAVLGTDQSGCCREI